MVTTLHNLQKGYVVLVLALVLLAGTFGGATKVGMATSLHHSAAIHSTQQLAGLHPHLECPPPPYNCQGG